MKRTRLESVCQGLGLAGALLAALGGCAENPPAAGADGPPVTGAPAASTPAPPGPAGESGGRRAQGKGLAGSGAGGAGHAGGQGASAGSSSGSWPGPGPFIRPLPFGPKSACDPAEVKVSIENNGKPVEPAKVEALAAQVSLKTWPGLVPVDVTVKAVPSDPYADMLADAWVLLERKAPLADEWHVLVVAKVPPGFNPETAGDKTLAGLPAGASETLFRPGSDPRVSRVEMCHEKAGDEEYYKVWVTVTESIAADGTPASVLTVKQDGNKLACSDFGESIPPGGLSVNCPGFDVSKTTEISVDSSVKSAVSGKPVTDWKGNPWPTFTFVPAKVEQHVEGCMGFKLY
ncbi:MAG: hypothetical protein HY744_21095 [Deltaproteobacteria bacterium]|nr:hypothetical protein [Deltaproteobacteria bacterium]